MPRRTARGAHGCIAEPRGNSHEMAIRHARRQPRWERLPGPQEQAAPVEPAARAGVQPEREAGERALRGARADHRAQGGSDKLCAPPSTYGVYLAANEDQPSPSSSQGRKVKVNLHPSLKA